MLVIWAASNECPVSWHMFRFVMTFTNNPRNRATPTKPGTKHSFIWLAAGISRPDLLARLFNGFIAGGILKVQRQAETAK